MPTLSPTWLRREYCLAHGDGKRIVEVKWTLAPAYFAPGLDTAGTWERLAPVRIGGRDLPTLGREDLLLTLCVHGASHLWIALEQLCAVAALIRAAPALDWDALLRRARAQGVCRIVLVNLLLANSLLGLELPPTIGRGAQADPQARRLSCALHDLLLDERDAPPSIATYARFQLAMQERTADRARYCLHLLLSPFLPTADDIARSSLPPMLAPLYYLLRPLRLLAKYARRLLGRAR